MFFNKRRENQIDLQRLVQIFEQLIIQTETETATRIRSFKHLLNQDYMTINLNDYTGKFDKMPITFFKNTTLWELKEKISTKLKICIDFIEIHVNDKELTSLDNGRSIWELGLRDGDQIKIHLNSQENLIPQEELCIDDKVNPKLITIFENLYTDFSPERKMTAEQCAKLIQFVTGSKDTIAHDDQRITGLYKAYDKDGDGILEMNEFVGFYSESCLKQDKKRVVWDNLRTMEIRNDLKKVIKFDFR